MAHTKLDGFCFHCGAVNMKRRPRLSQGLKTRYWFYCCCSMQPGSGRFLRALMSEGHWHGFLCEWEMNPVRKLQSTSLHSLEDLSSHVATLGRPLCSGLPRWRSLGFWCDHLVSKRPVCASPGRCTKNLMADHLEIHLLSVHVSAHFTANVLEFADTDSSQTSVQSYACAHFH